MTIIELPNCPKCKSEYTYEDGHFYVCPECGHEWREEMSTEETKEEIITKDVFGNELRDGDNVTVIKDLKIKGSSAVVKQGTNIKGIRIIEGDHDIDCRVPGHGNMQLKSEFLKKI